MALAACNGSRHQASQGTKVSEVGLLALLESIPPIDPLAVSSKMYSHKVEVKPFNRSDCPSFQSQPPPYPDLHLE